MRSLLRHGNVGPSSGIWLTFHPWPSSVSLPRIPGILVMAYRDVIAANLYATSIFTPFLIPDLKRRVLKLVASFQLREQVGPANLGQSAPSKIPCASASLDLRLTFCQSSLHSFLPCFSPLRISPCCGIHQSCYSVVESGRQTQVLGGPWIGESIFECTNLKFPAGPLPWLWSLLRLAPSEFFLCLLLCHPPHARLQSPCAVGSCPSSCVRVKVFATPNHPCSLLGYGILRWYG